MKRKCRNQDCLVHTSGGACFLEHEDLTDCPAFDQGSIRKPMEGEIKDKVGVPWSGDSLKYNELNHITGRGRPYLISPVGTQKAGKTTFLGMLFTLLHRGMGPDFGEFAESISLDGWEKLAQKLRFYQNNVSFPDPTPRNPDYESILHLGFRTGQSLKDFLFVEYSGENFSKWAEDASSPIAKNPRWIHKHSSAFILFADCEALIKDKALARNNVVSIAQRLSEGLAGRPVALAWSKADRMQDVPPKLIEKLRRQVSDWLPNIKEFEISSKSLSDPDEKCHVNNWLMVNWIFKELEENSGQIQIETPMVESTDFFINYGKY